MSQPKLFIATKAFITHKGKVLIVRESSRYKDGSNTGSFDVVGGRLEPGERFDKSLKREVKEETGLKINISKPFFVNEWRPEVRGESWQIVGVFFKCEAKSNSLKLSRDHDSYEWIDPTMYKSYQLIPNLRPAFEAFLDI